MSIFAAAWSWFIGTKAGRWIVGAVLLIGGLLAALAIAFVKGERRQADEDAAKQAQAVAEGEQVAQQVQTDATKAAEQVRQDAAKQPPPDAVKRDDLNNSF